MLLTFVILYTLISSIFAHDAHVTPHGHRAEFKFFVNYGEVVCFSEEFHEEVHANYTFEYQVFHEGNVNVWMEWANNNRLYHNPEGQRDQVSFLVAPQASLSFCFYNNARRGSEIVYLLLRPTRFSSQIDHIRPGPAGSDETLCESIQWNVAHIRDHQKNYRNSVENGRAFADILNLQVGILASVTTVGMLIVNLGQTIVLKRLFMPKREHNSGFGFQIDMPDSPTWN
uniref:GOLD domain-containing protein n=1 Tax=Plectus sambesii TaxID=2011161 RepID=A0A914WNG6_9BILA